MASRECVIANLKRLSVNPRFILTSSDSPAVYEDILKDIPDETLNAAVTQYLSEANQFTPVPTPGVLREKAMDLQMLALGVPTGGEAWGMVLAAVKYTGPRWCKEGAALREAIDPTKWPTAYYAHMDKCNICSASGRSEENYGHPTVTQTVRLLGGRDAIITDNSTSDRARFVDMYQEVVLRERMRAGMTPQVREFVNDQQELFDSVDPVYRLNNGISDVVEIMDKRRKDLE